MSAAAHLGNDAPAERRLRARHSSSVRRYGALRNPGVVLIACLEEMNGGSKMPCGLSAHLKDSVGSGQHDHIVQPTAGLAADSVRHI
jgi:hypothetical protein